MAIMMTAGPGAGAGSAAEIAFSTSGSTGDPVTWYRAAGQLDREVDLICGAVIGEVDFVVSFAPPTHLFGKLFGEILPHRYGIGVCPMWRDPSRLSGLRFGRRTLFVTLPASWLLLRRIADQLARLPEAIALHGAGPVTDATAETAAALAGTRFRIIEIYGSTETGGVAVREFPSARAVLGQWQLLSDVDFVAPSPDEKPLTVRSPRIARPAGALAPSKTHPLTDIVKVIDDRHFELIGRQSRLVKVNGVRCDLNRVENLVRAALPGVDVVCVGVQDSVRGEHYDLYHVAGADPRIAGQIRAALSRAPDLVPVPRMIHVVAQIPRTCLGKTNVSHLGAMAPPGPRLSGGSQVQDD
jgi:acyl-coenzyme A synthetase/AMP-(fatty) acid ligase